MPCAVLVVMCYDSLRACILASLFFSLTGSSAAGSGLNICSWCFHHFLSSACIVHFVLEVALVTTNYLHSRFVLLDEICCQLGVSRAIAVQVVVKWLHSKQDGMMVIKHFSRALLLKWWCYIVMGSLSFSSPFQCGICGHPEDVQCLFTLPSDTMCYV
jgi:hypothetical protein